MTDPRILRRLQDFMGQPDSLTIKERQEKFAVSLRKEKRMEAIEFKRSMKKEQCSVQEYCLYIGNFPIDMVQMFPMLTSLNTEYSKLKALNDIIQDLTLDSLVLLRILKIFRNALLGEEDVNPRALFLRANLIETLSSILHKSHNTDVLTETIWCLCNIAAGPSEYSQAILSTKPIPRLLFLIKEGNESVIENSTWLLANLVSDSERDASEILREDYLKILLDVNCLTDKVAEGVIISLVNITKFTEILNDEDYLTILKMLQKLKNFDDVGILWSISNLCQGGSKKIQLVIDSGIVNLAFSGLLLDEKYSIPASEIILNLSASDDSKTDYLLEHSLLDLLNRIILKTDCKTLKNIFCILRNITASPKHQSTVYKHQVFTNTLQGLTHNSHVVCIEASYFFYNISKSLPEEEIFLLVSSGIFSHLYIALNSIESELILISLDICHNMLEAKNEFPQVIDYFKETSCLAVVEELVIHLNIEISEKASELISVHFETL